MKRFDLIIFPAVAVVVVVAVVAAVVVAVGVGVVVAVVVAVAVSRAIVNQNCDNGAQKSVVAARNLFFSFFRAK